MPELAPKPTREHLAQIARAVEPGARAGATRQLLGGFSCRMDILELALPSGDSRSIVVRQYGLWHRDDDPHPGTVESVVLEHLNTNGIPALELILGDETTWIMGAPAIVTSLIDGHPNLNPVDSESWAAQLVAAVAEVHSLPIHESLQAVIQPLYPGLEK